MQDAQPTQDATPPQDAPAPDESVIEGSVDGLREQALAIWDNLQSHMLTLGVAIEGAILIAAILPAAFFGPRLRKLIQTQIAPRAPYGVLRRAANAFAHLATPIALYILLQAAVLGLQAAGSSSNLISAGVSLLTAWIVIRLVTLVIRSPFWSRVAFYVAWPIAALDAFGVLDDVVRQLQAFSFPIGEDENGVAQTFSALDFLRMLAVFGVLFWGARFLNHLIQGRINAIDELTVSFKALLAKILDVLLPVVALVLALQIVGFPFGTLAIFGGAIGLGIGLGMQRTVSNFFAGFTLIADKSIKPGDVIEVAGTYGWVTAMNARYVSLRTRDGTAHLVPNDKFIEDGVVNWSHDDRVVRLHAPFGVSYSTKDLRGLARAAEERALTIDRVLKSPAPRCNVMEFGDSSVNFDLRFWINDPANGSANVRSDVYMAIWDMLHEMNIEIPFPQRDLHLKSVPDDFLTSTVETRAEALSNSRED
ncbi:mechanosensitive ion channel family protein [Hyphococcus luteus]|uniref:Mechanosensitive ion channel protein MscS n=1 Tax=Hyphococcus luteus TaxID=2058213 RepID=A0A2S7K6D1_9PROT|nr:mechanosensitive ion channel domain-containing protein [Marinicaulis flavus]PQA88036.1 mechanosensitive ion channel protein MscS [Marinicaulis flavus]